MVRRLLLIDDDPIVNLIHSKIVRSEFPEIPVNIFENGLRALEFIRVNTKSPFVIFLDINMPIMNGWKFLEAISPYQDELDLQIHILTSSVDKGDRVKATQFKQVQSFLHKPLTKSQLVDLKENFFKP